MTNLLSLQGCDIGYRCSQPLLTEVRLQLDAGQFWFLLGANGTGKSSLLRTLLGLLPPLSGRLQRARLITGFVPQKSPAFEQLPLTLSELIEQGLTGLSLSRDERRQRLQATLAQFDLTALADKTFSRMSGGQQQRGLIARALIRQPQLLLLDEPSNHLDLNMQHRLFELLKPWQQQSQACIVCVSHDIELARRHGSHVALLRDQRLYTGCSQDLLQQYGQLRPESEPVC